VGLGYDKNTVTVIYLQVHYISVGLPNKTVADALKLLLKEYVSPTQANLILFFLGPVITLVFSLLGYAVIPYGPGLAISDYNLGILYMLAVSSLSTYGILLAG
jgi:NADH-ubiquinone oxidoreductase chain 1